MLIHRPSAGDLESEPSKWGSESGTTVSQEPACRPLQCGRRTVRRYAMGDVKELTEGELNITQQVRYTHAHANHTRRDITVFTIQETVVPPEEDPFGTTQDDLTRGVHESICESARPEEGFEQETPAAPGTPVYQTHSKQLKSRNKEKPKQRKSPEPSAKAKRSKSPVRAKATPTGYLPPHHCHTECVPRCQC
jgi:hypothetical protein